MEEFRNIEKVLEAISSVIEAEGNIAIYGDYDVDGLMSLMLFKDSFEFLNYNKVFAYPYYSRTHEVDFNLLNFCLSRKIDLVIICDSGSDNMDLLSRFCAYDIKCVVLDHHTSVYSYDDFPAGCVVINTTIDRILYNIRNEMCGGGVAFVVCKALLERYGVEFDVGYLAVYALLAQYADAIPMDTEFGRFVYEAAAMRKSVPKHVDYFMESYNGLTKRFAEYTFAPKINAVFRREQFNLINNLFVEPVSDAFLIVNQIKELHTSTISIVKDIVSMLRSEELNGIVVANLTPLLNSSLPNNFITNHKGRIANSLSNIEGKPCICVCDSGKRIEGSFRDIGGRNYLKYFAPLFKAGGHPPAFGFSLPYADWPYFFNTIRSVGEMAAAESDEQVQNPEYDMTDYLDLDHMRQIAYENEFVSPRHPATFVRVHLNKVVEATKYGLSYLLYSNGSESVWFTSDKKIQHAQEVLLYPYLQKDLKLKAIWR